MTLAALADPVGKHRYVSWRALLHILGWIIGSSFQYSSKPAWIPQHRWRNQMRLAGCLRARRSSSAGSGVDQPPSRDAFPASLPGTHSRSRCRADVSFRGTLHRLLHRLGVCAAAAGRGMAAAAAAKLTRSLNKKAAHLAMRCLCNRLCCRAYLLVSTTGMFAANCRLISRSRRRSIWYHKAVFLAEITFSNIGTYFERSEP